MNVLVTGGAGFIGSAVCRELIGNTGHRVINVDKLTYAAGPDPLARVAGDRRYRFVRLDICKRVPLCDLMSEEDIGAVIHLAAETHVDRSIDQSAMFIQTNVTGTHSVLEAAREHWQRLDAARRDRFRLIHVSTDEVYGPLGSSGRVAEGAPYNPSSPYAASKAASDHLVAAWFRTYGLPTVITASSNNFGPYQFPEKLVPLITTNALLGKELPVYGAGDNVRDWLFVEDHARALLLVLDRAQPGQRFNVGGDDERTTLGTVREICSVLDRLMPRCDGNSYGDRICLVSDRPGHDFRYALDCSKIKRELGWERHESFESGLEKTVAWFIGNEDWWRPIRENVYDGARLGLRAGDLAPAGAKREGGASR